MARALRLRNGPRTRGGFTLIELLVVLGMLVGVLAIAYGMIVDCLEADRTIERLTLPEKVGEGIISMVRADLAGTIYRKLGRRVFFVADNGMPPDARDELRFLSTVEPTPIEEAGAEGVSVTELRGIIGVAYTLRPSSAAGNIPAFTLFRKEILELDPENPLEGRGRNSELYDKVAYFNVDCYDGWSWYSDWDSERRIQEEEAALAAEEAAGQGRVARVSDARSTSSVLTTPGVDPTAEEGEEVLPPAGIPVAVRVELGMYVAPGGKLLTDAQGAPVLKTYATVVPVLASQRLAMDFEEEIATEALSGLGGLEGEGSGDVVRGAILGGLPGFPGEAKPAGKRPPGAGRGEGPGGRSGRERGAFPSGRGGRARGAAGQGALPGGVLP
ncbi:MAG: type II secretion system protein, partial [Planctomycetota bacterium]